MKRNLALLLSLLVLLCAVNYGPTAASAQDNTVSTEDLVYQLLESGICNSIIYRNYSGQSDFNYLKEKYPALAQLEQRTDAVEVLVDMIEERANTQDINLFYLSLLIHEPEFYQLLSEEQKAQVTAATQILYAPAAHTQAATETVAATELYTALSVSEGARSTPSSFYYGAYYYAYSTTIYTLDDQEIYLHQTTSDFAQWVKEERAADLVEQFPNIEIQALASACYNCFSYAWYDSTDSNDYWMQNCDNYLYDLHADGDSKATVGAICMYFDRLSGSRTTLHAGVVTAVNGAEVTIVSKWGQNCLVEHERKDVPSDYKASDGNVYCYYYTYPDDHLFELIDSNATTHTVECTVCYETKTNNHNYTRVISSDASCHTLGCSTCTYTQTAAHTLNGLGICKVCGYSGPTTIDALPEDPVVAQAACCGHG